ncbi:MAG TPA: GNAT family N-acetyltransferase [Pyrinomonadaceae bacterium]|nr:GNAT family N-acetyltransferase [Pyrinomonadaceae bacterium]
MNTLLREFEERDWPDLVRFYEEFYRPGYILTKREFFDWNFCSSLRPDERCGQRLILDDNRVVGVMGALSWPLQVNHRQEIGEYNINLYLDPAYRGQRMGQRLLESVCSGYRYSISSGYHERTLSMYERLGTVYHWNMLRFTKCIDPVVCEALLHDTTSVAGAGEEAGRLAVRNIRTSSNTVLPQPSFTFERVSRFDADWDAAWEGLRQGYGFTTWRSAEFLNWRYIDYPYPLYECYLARQGAGIAGLVVLRVEPAAFGPVLRIVDLICDAEGRPEILAFCDDFAKQGKVVFIDFIFCGEMDFSQLKAAGYVELSDQSSGATLLPMDFNPLRYRSVLPILVTLRDPEDSAAAEIERGAFYFVKGDGDQDRAN